MEDSNINELNPNHPTTQFAREQWVKIVGLMMYMDDRRVVCIPRHILDKVAEGGEDLNVTIEFDDTLGIILRLVDTEEAKRLAKEHGGLPV